MPLDPLQSIFEPTRVQIWCAAGVGLLGASAGLLTGRMLRRRRRPKVTAADSSARHDPFLDGSMSDHRQAPRRGDNPVEVVISDAEANAPAISGWVQDRSLTGLSIAVAQPFPLGTVLSVRASEASTRIPWVKVEVRNCRPAADRWDLGCLFLQTPNWETMLLFG